MNPGEYPQPLSKVGWSNFVAFSGFTTARWRYRNISGTTGIGSGLKPSTLVVQNVGSTAVTLQIKESNNIGSGTRTNVGSAFTVAANGGINQQTFTPTKNILEVSCTSGTSEVRCQMQSLLGWDFMPFDKNDIYYPPQLIKGKLPAWTTTG